MGLVDTLLFFFCCFFSKYLHIIIIMDTKRFKIVSCTGCHLKKKAEIDINIHVLI